MKDPKTKDGTCDCDTCRNKKPKPASKPASLPSAANQPGFASEKDPIDPSAVDPLFP